MFSPFYAWSRRHGAGKPQQHVALNAVLYGRRKRWAMTERGSGALDAGPQHLSIGPSALAWDGDVLTVNIEEVAVPWPARIRGTVRVHPAALPGQGFALDDAGRHRWSPIAPVSRVEVALDSPALSWSGPGYLDTNSGIAALEDDFVYWDWCRAPTDAGATILYNASRRVGGEQALALRVARDGGLERMEPPPPAPLPRTLWRMVQGTRADAGHTPALRQRLEDTPFYARSVIGTRLYGEDVAAVHESLSLDRFRAPWVQAMLPFRIPSKWGSAPSPSSFGRGSG